jgi:crotonobetainyl-CoA:carnitine CoA-transferase CaiB-like acyl-CoA transferase
VDELVSDPQAIAAGAFVRVPAAAGDAASEGFNGVATPLDFSATPVGPAGAPPAVGADADALLAGIGMSAQEIERLRVAGVLAARPAGAAA